MFEREGHRALQDIKDIGLAHDHPPLALHGVRPYHDRLPHRYCSDDQARDPNKSGVGSQKSEAGSRKSDGDATPSPTTITTTLLTHSSLPTPNSRLPTSDSASPIWGIAPPYSRFLS